MSTSHVKMLNDSDIFAAAGETWASTRQTHGLVSARLALDDSGRVDGRLAVVVHTLLPRVPS